MSKQVFIQVKDTLSKALDRNQEWQRAKASGKADAYIKSLESAVITESTYKQYGLSYTPFIDTGRNAGSPPPVSALYDWLAYKKYGFTYSSDKERLSLAFALSKSIAEKGSYKSRGNQTDVFGKVFEDVKMSLGELLRERERINIEAPILEEIRKIKENR